MGEFSRETIKIPSIEEGVSLDVWYYKPSTEGPHPVVVAGHGLTVRKDAGYAAFGEEWAKRAGFASLILDYRFFGDSDGEPRNLVVTEKQLQDYRSVIEWARGRPELFLTNKIVVMGSASSGLHVANLVVDDDSLAGGMMHAPLLDGYAVLMSMTPNPRLLFWAAIDVIRSKLGMSPIFIKAMGRQNEFALLNTPSTYPGFVSMFAQGEVSFAEAPNKIAPRFAFDLMASRPGLKLKSAKCPVLVVLAQEDDMIPARITRKLAADSNGKVKLVEAPGGHFEIMKGGRGFEININSQIEFLRELK